MKTIPGFPNYAVTKDGRVWSKPRRDRLGRRWGGMWLRPGKSSAGYFTVCLSNRKQRKSFCLHILVLNAWVGLCPPKMECRHLDGNKLNNSLGNLAWGTSGENRVDSYSHGIMPKGGDSHFAKLNERNVKDILHMYHRDNISAINIAKMYGLNRHHVHDIVAGRSWKQIWNQFINL